MLTPRRQEILGWLGVSVSVLFSGIWGFWGSVENFFEGWWFTSLWKDLAVMFGRYLAPMIVVVAASAIALRWRRSALPVFGLAIAIALFSHPNAAGVILIAIPLLILGILFHFGSPHPRVWALRAVICLPILTAVVCGVYPGWRAVNRYDDGNHGMRLVVGNGVELVWAPEGPGWPSHYASWWQAQHVCTCLSADGRSISSKPQDLWRLPTIDEAVRSMVYRGRNAGGTWDPARDRARYRVTPNKDSPLWNPHSPVIYWWTSSEFGRNKAFRIAYNGNVAAFVKRGWGNYWAYRCVSEPPGQATLPTRSDMTGGRVGDARFLATSPLSIW